MSQFNYCQLVWMCHDCTKTNKINRLHERYLCLIYNDKKASFEQLLEIDSLSISLAIEMYKIHHGISPTIMNEIFILRHQNKHNLKNWTYLDVRKVRTVNHGSEQPPEVFYGKRCSQKFQKIHRKTPAPESLF